MKRDSENIKRDLAHVCWIGGSSGGGKTTTAKALEEKFGFHVYHHVDKWMGGDHARVADPDRHPAMVRFREILSHMSVPQLFETFPVDELVEGTINYFIEEFEMVVDDLYELPRDKPIVAEGSGILPGPVSRVTKPNRTIFLVATEAFERRRRSQANQESPEPWFEKMIESSSKRREQTVLQAEHLELKIIETDGSRSIEDTFDLVKGHFGLS